MAWASSPTRAAETRPWEWRSRQHCRAWASHAAAEAPTAARLKAEAMAGGDDEGGSTGGSGPCARRRSRRRSDTHTDAGARRALSAASAIAPPNSCARKPRRIAPHKEVDSTGASSSLGRTPGRPALINALDWIWGGPKRHSGASSARATGSDRMGGCWHAEPGSPANARGGWYPVGALAAARRPFRPAPSAPPSTPRRGPLTPRSPGTEPGAGGGHSLSSLIPSGGARSRRGPPSSGLWDTAPRGREGHSLSSLGRSGMGHRPGPSSFGPQGSMPGAR